MLHRKIIMWSVRRLFLPALTHGINTLILYKHMFPRIVFGLVQLTSTSGISSILFPELLLTLIKLSKDWFLNKKIKFSFIVMITHINLIGYLVVSINFLIFSVLGNKLILYRLFGGKYWFRAERSRKLLMSTFTKTSGLVSYSPLTGSISQLLESRSFLNSTRDRCNRIFNVSFLSCECFQTSYLITTFLLVLVITLPFFTPPFIYLVSWHMFSEHLLFTE